MAISDSTPQTVEIQMNQGNVITVDFVDVDEELLHPKWVSRNKNGKVYAMRFVKPYIKRRGTQQALHRFIMERIIGRQLTENEMVDHVNGNPLDNRRCNLRIATNAQNSSNQLLSSANKTGYKGVWIRQGKIVASITVNYKHISLGSFETYIDAAIAYNNAAVKYFGEFAKLNPIDGWESISPTPAKRKPRKEQKSKPFYTRVRNQGKRWAFLVTRNGKQRSLGLYDTESEAREHERIYILENAA